MNRNSKHEIRALPAANIYRDVNSFSREIQTHNPLFDSTHDNLEELRLQQVEVGEKISPEV